MTLSQTAKAHVLSTPTVIHIQYKVGATKLNKKTVLLDTQPGIQ